MTYPATPARGRTRTSREAAERIDPVHPTLRQRVLAYIVASGLRGVTADQCVEHFPDHPPYSIRPRVTELGRLGLIRRARRARPNRRGNNEDVWVAVRGSGTRS